MGYSHLQPIRPDSTLAHDNTAVSLYQTPCVLTKGSAGSGHLSLESEHDFIMCLVLSLQGMLLIIRVGKECANKDDTLVTAVERVKDNRF